jgi:hypothetical protein
MNRNVLALGAAFLGLAAAPAPLFAQQFVHQAGLLTEKLWTEGVEPADIDNDGDIDLFFANGDGFASAGTQRQNKLYRNRLEISANNWVDESVARLGTSVSCARQVVTGDVDNDGWIDALFCNGFDTDPPFLFINQGAASPGFYTNQSSSRGLTELLSSASGQFGDLDNDGDLDLIICDVGANYLGGSGDEPRLYLNNGSGVFTEQAAKLGAVARKAQMDVQLVDVDNDFDLDFFGPCRADNGAADHYLMINDGKANFTDSSSLITTTSTNTYEADVGDLDGDNDLDMFFVSLSGFAEGHVRNNFAGSGTLTFTNGSSLGSDDDNEIALLDADNDGDYDVIVGSLGGNEKLIRNNGGLSFSSVSGAFTAVSDSSLDCSVADFDNDGSYDVVTAQGESGMSQFDNKIYLNNGVADTRAPIVALQETLPSLPPANGPWVVRARIRDAVMDDGQDWVSATGRYRLDTAGGPGAWIDASATRMGGGQWRFAMVDVAEGLATTLRYDFTFTDWAGNVTTTATTVVPLGPPCGIVPYGLAETGANILVGGGRGNVTPGGTFQVTVDTNIGGVAIVALAFGRADFPIFGGTGLIEPTTFTTYQVANVVSGTATTFWNVPNSAALVGARAHFQGFQFDGSQPAGFALSNGVEAAICQ